MSNQTVECVHCGGETQVASLPSDLTDEQWSLIADLFSAPVPSPLDHRTLHRMAASLPLAGDTLRVLLVSLSWLRKTRLSHDRSTTVLKPLLVTK
jgi:hypothetical protein